MVWINEVLKPQIQLVVSLKFRPKGLILVTEQYDVFLYSSSIQAKQITEAYEFWLQNELQGVELWIHPDKTQKLGFSIKPGKQIVWFANENSLSLSEPDSIENPFLAATIKQNQKHPPFPLHDSQILGMEQTTLERQRKKRSEGTTSAKNPLLGA